MRARITLAAAIVAAFSLGTAALAERGALQNLRAHLSGDAEVPPRATRATGQTVLQLEKTGEALRFRLIASNIHNVVAAHIHLGPEGQNGPVVAFLFGNAPAGGGRQDGVLSQGVITAADLVGPLAGADLDALMTEIRSGNAYVNVHTNDGVAPPNTGPGDFPGGEIRGQIDTGGPPR
jgi:hypothetical protein